MFYIILFARQESTVTNNDLKTKNTAVITAQIPLNTARISRNDVLYKANIGVVDKTVDVKNYVKSVYSATSPPVQANFRV